METILVTGGAGFIGSHLCERLLARGDHIICVDNLDPYYSPDIKKRNIMAPLTSKLFKYEQCDIRDHDGMRNVFNSYQIDDVIHLAARAGVRASINNPLLYQDVNIRGTVNLLELSKEYKIKSFIFASSSSVYGNSSRVPFKENNTPLQPISPYAASKQACELFCYTYHHLFNISTTCLRFFTVYGPRQRPDMAIYKFTQIINQGEELMLYGDGSSKRDYTYIGDIIEGIVAALDAKLDFEIINLGNSVTTNLKQLITLIEKCLGKKAYIKFVPEQPGDVKITCADISKAKKLLNFIPLVGMAQGIEQFVKWYQKEVNKK